jgi:hypothetical protein
MGIVGLALRRTDTFVAMALLIVVLGAVSIYPALVAVAVARPSLADNERVLPGNALPLLEAGLYPRATGDIKTRLVDISDHVGADPQPGQRPAAGHVKDEGPDMKKRTGRFPIPS